MRNEILALKGRIAETKQKIKQKELLISGLIISIRNLANPYEDNVLNLRTDELLVSAQTLGKAREELIKYSADLQQYEHDLGGE